LGGKRNLGIGASFHGLGSVRGKLSLEYLSVLFKCTWYLEQYLWMFHGRCKGRVLEDKGESNSGDMGIVNPIGQGDVLGSLH